MMFSKRLPILLILFAQLAGCSLFAPRQDTGALREGGFAVTGRLGVNRGSDGFSSSFLWRYTKPDFDIELWGPLGQGRTRIEGRGEEVTIREANGTVHRSRDTAETMERWLGVSVPVSALVHWLRGEPAPESPVMDERFEAADRIHLSQLAWQLDFSGYKEVPGGGRVPSRIVAQRDNVRVTLLPKEWTFPQAAR
jgi:outer membrane lipoprotein LolB